MRVLAGDIGGTKTLLQISDVAAGARQVLFERRYASQSYPDLLPMVQAFLQEAGAAASGITRACIGVAGPVTGRRAKVTNLPWALDAETLSARLGIPHLHFLNDFQILGYGIEALSPADCAVLQEGHQLARGPRVVIGAGTGLGEAVLVWQTDHYEVLPSEGGHADFAPTDALQIELLRHLMGRFGRVTYERVVSGPGLLNIYRFLQERAPPPAARADTDVQRAADPAAAISAAALRGSDPLAVQALDLFVRIYGAQAGNLALTCLPTGGVYIAGGIAPQLIDYLQRGAFMEAFLAKGRMRRLLQTMAVQVIMNPKVGLLGAALVASRL